MTRHGGAALLASLVMLAACSSSPPPRRTASSGGAGPGEGGYYKIGRPYQINGVTYTPAWDPDYSETGIASWYAGEFTGEPTANGELYDPNQLTAAHRTLPMPSLVRVTNLDNGRALIIRVNDRGPYAQNRILDCSRRCAQLLGFEQKGTAKVKVEIMAQESLALADAARHGELATTVASAIETNPITPQAATVAPPVEVASNEPGEMPQIEQPAVQPAAPPPPVIESQPLPASQTLQQPGAPAPLADQAGGLKVVNEKAVIHKETGDTLAGQSVGGRYLPAPVVRHEKVGKTKIYVQAGAFASQDNADHLRDRLQTLGTQVLPVTVNGRQFYRVRVGPLPDVPSADAELQRVLQAGAAGAKIVVE